MNQIDMQPMYHEYAIDCIVEASYALEEAYPPQFAIVMKHYFSCPETCPD